MKAPHLQAAAATAVALLFALPAEARDRPSGLGVRTLPPGNHGGWHGRRGFFYPFVFVEREPVIIEREIVREVPVVVAPPEPPPPPRKPYKIGASYASLPGGCMKMIEDGASYYLCSGEWYRQVGDGSATTYKAIAQP